MAENPTHLETHRGKTKAIRYLAAAPTDPTPVSGDIYIDNTSGTELLCIMTANTWITKPLSS